MRRTEIYIDGVKKNVTEEREVKAAYLCDRRACAVCNAGCGYTTNIISIHKALASLDGKNAQLFLHLCHIYMLHIIHLLQIVYQVEISSRNLIVFSGQL